MYFITFFQFTVAIPLLLTLFTNSYNKRAFAGSTVRCLSNFYKDGNDCKECPAGYFGINCSTVCPPSYYGQSCAYKCDCLPCHYIYGCDSNTLPYVAETTSYASETRDKLKDTTKTPETTSNDYGNKDKTKFTKQTPENFQTLGKNITISVGSLLCITLTLIIIREICVCCRFPRPVFRRTTLNDVYSDIAGMGIERTE